MLFRELQILLLRIAFLAGLALFMRGDAAFVRAFLAFGGCFLAAGFALHAAGERGDGQKGGGTKKDTEKLGCFHNGWWIR
ncbi:MAG TPA: hypothetical protein VHH88_02740 [Verrucomicrobiae bacterium]|nr:hypothetical protein [Verrucomicrobiae bacterium]